MSPAQGPEASSSPSHRGSVATARPTPSSNLKIARRACDPCSISKRRCDGAQPICGVCKILNKPCKYERVVGKRGPKRKRPQPDSSRSGSPLGQVWDPHEADETKLPRLSALETIRTPSGSADSDPTARSSREPVRKQSVDHPQAASGQGGPNGAHQTNLVTTTLGSFADPWASLQAAGASVVSSAAPHSDGLLAANSLGSNELADLQSLMMPLFPSGDKLSPDSSSLSGKDYSTELKDAVSMLRYWCREVASIGGHRTLCQELGSFLQRPVDGEQRGPVECSANAPARPSDIRSGGQEGKEDVSTFVARSGPSSSRDSGSCCDFDAVAVASPSPAIALSLEDPGNERLGEMDPMTLSTEHASGLLQNFWSFSHPHWPVLYKPAFDSLPSDVVRAKTSRPLYLAMLAHGCKYSRLDSRGGGGGASTFNASHTYQRSFLRSAVRTFLSSNLAPTLDLAQAALLLAILLQGEGESGKAWVFRGAAASTLTLLTATSPDSPGLSHHEREAFLRACSACDLFSVALAAELGCPCPKGLTETLKLRRLNEMEPDEYEFFSRVSSGGDEPATSWEGRKHVASTVNNGFALLNLLQRVLHHVVTGAKGLRIVSLTESSVRSMDRDVVARAASSDPSVWTTEEFKAEQQSILEGWKTRPGSTSSVPNVAATELWLYVTAIIFHRFKLQQHSDQINPAWTPSERVGVGRGAGAGAGAGAGEGEGCGGGAGHEVDETCQARQWNEQQALLAFSECVSAARKIVDLLKRLREDFDLSAFPPCEAFAIFTAATVHIYSMVASPTGGSARTKRDDQGDGKGEDEGRRAVDDLGVCMEVLEEMATRWPVAKAYVYLLRGE
ncbi:hypothetical protein IE53DRAFT_361124 [Violaceomyces palustris]|uniref:Uncharacterized protein n=1 Tax=Violaceomyces palustris TaxID=1673888 RepID=A0ACD0P1X3_9BASI|nr:hypothetical protein IE53DRAFT_361124 [Violaceomyces palustris]